MNRPQAFSSAALVLSFCACSGGGGGGGGSTTPPTTPAAPASVSGDMIAATANKGWNYQTTYNNNPLTVTIYADPKSGQVQALIASGVAGLVPTVATSAANMNTNLLGALGVSADASSNYNAVSEVSAGSIAAIPGSPLLIPSTLTVGQTWSASGGTATVTSIGNVPNASACAVAATGATVRYSYANFNYSISYVPGCGITDFVNNANGAEFKLISIGNYPAIGTLGVARKTASATLVDTAASLLGLRHLNLPAARLMPF